MKRVIQSDLCTIDKFGNDPLERQSVKQVVISVSSRLHLFLQLKCPFVNFGFWRALEKDILACVRQSVMCLLWACWSTNTVWCKSKTTQLLSQPQVIWQAVLSSLSCLFPSQASNRNRKHRQTDDKAGCTCSFHSSLWSWDSSLGFLACLFDAAITWVTLNGSKPGGHPKRANVSGSYPGESHTPPC